MPAPVSLPPPPPPPPQHREAEGSPPDLYDVAVQRICDHLRHTGQHGDDLDPPPPPSPNASLVTCAASGPVDGGDDRQDLLHEPGIVFRHEIVFSSVERPRVLSRLTALVSEVGLNILGAGIYNTVDGFCLFVFLVDGWESKDAGDLIAKLEDTALRRGLYRALWTYEVVR
ncbi:hypothetical protein HU200_056095 [Digitaria exilis]|uniref:ACT domain-containing protein n=1 Tax=Digitaria exilis TaxID=1010633 RepID=A0A835AD15_9POAL|nr:hypothetical protein HU200_056095 [Digitaria exilis]